MKKIVLLSFIFLLFSCNKNENIVKGDLYFKLVNFTPQDGMSEKQANEIEKMLDDSKSIPNQNKDMKILIEYFEKLKKHNLLRAPYIKLMFDKDDVKTVFLSTSEYQKIKKYTIESLDLKKKKLEVELKIIELDKDIYYSDKIINISEINGKTYFEK